MTSTASETIASTVRAADQELLATAKRNVDLGGFLSVHGFTILPDKDTARHPILAGPGGERVRVTRATVTGDWVWADLRTGDSGGTIIDACEQLLGLGPIQTLITIRQAVKNPPTASPVSPGSHTSTAGTRSSEEPRLPHALKPLSQAAAEFLVERCCIYRATVDAFADYLRADPHTGHLVCPHNADGDGEEYWLEPDGSTRKHFTGDSLDDCTGRGRSLWYAHPRRSGPTMLVLVAESAVDALSAWQRLDPETQGCTQIISTGGSLSGAGKAKLRRLIEEAKEECRRAGGGKLPLVDASGVGKATTQVQGDTLHAFADNQGVKYVRWAPDDGCKDWNDVVIAEQRASEAQEAAQKAASPEEVQRDDLTPDSQQEKAPEGTRIGGGRSI